MSNYNNLKDCHLMVWDLNPKKREQISFVAPIDSYICIGDTITCGPESQYEITDIISEKPSSIKNMDYITAKVIWRPHLK